MYIYTYTYTYIYIPKGNCLKGFSRLQKYLTICRKINDSGKNCRLGHLPKMPKVTIYVFSAFPKNRCKAEGQESLRMPACFFKKF